MSTTAETSSRNIARSLSIGVLLSMLFFYAIHVLGKWEVENYRPDADTTYTVLLHNTCALLGKTHTLRPNTDVSNLGDGIDGTKLSGSCMNFMDGHIIAMVLLAIGLGGIIFVMRHFK